MSTDPGIGTQAVVPRRTLLSDRLFNAWQLFGGSGVTPIREASLTEELPGGRILHMQGNVTVQTDLAISPTISTPDIGTKHRLMINVHHVAVGSMEFHMQDSAETVDYGAITTTPASADGVQPPLIFVPTTAYTIIRLLPTFTGLPFNGINWILREAIVERLP